MHIQRNVLSLTKLLGANTVGMGFEPREDGRPRNALRLLSFKSHGNRCSVTFVPEQAVGMGFEPEPDNRSLRSRCDWQGSSTTAGAVAQGLFATAYGGDGI